MKLKEVPICCSFAWSPATLPPVVTPQGTFGNLLAAASVAGAMDDDFSSEAFLKLYGVDLGAGISSPDMPFLGQASMPDRAHRVDWTAFPNGTSLVAAGLVDGSIGVWNANGIIAGEGDAARVCMIQQHQGAVKACHFNPVQPHFLATGGADKELIIWNLEDPARPQVVPAFTKSTQATEIVDVRWNPKFAHILASSTAGGVVNVWDLKSKRSACVFQVSQQPCVAPALAWHPDVATYIAVARDDPQPVVQIWDLKKAMAPIRELHGHTGGVLGLSWCVEDPSILVSCGRDGRTIYWNPATGENLGEHARSENWIYDVKWANRAPAVLATASFDQRLTVHSCQDSGASRGPPPKWLRRPAAASFGGLGGLMCIPTAAGRNIRILQDLSNHGSLIEDDAAFHRELARLPPDSADRAAWIESQPKLKDAAVLAQMTATKSRQPLLTALGVGTTTAGDAEEFLPIPDEAAIADAVAKGDLNGAVTMCARAERFDDAFAIAQIAGPDALKAAHVAYVAAKARTSRIAAFVGAMGGGRFNDLASSPHAASHWRQILALYATCLNANQFAVATDALATHLQEAGDLDASLTCLLAGGLVNRVAAIVRKVRPTMSDRDYVALITLVEQAARAECTDTAFGVALANHASALAAAGGFAAAVSYAARAAKIGVSEAAVVADRMQHMVAPSQRIVVDFPFGARVALPEPSTPEALIIVSKQTPVPGARAAAPGPASSHVDPVAAKAAVAAAHGGAAPVAQAAPGLTSSGLPANTGGMAPPTAASRQPAALPGSTGGAQVPFPPHPAAAGGPSPAGSSAAPFAPPPGRGAPEPTQPPGHGAAAFVPPPARTVPPPIAAPPAAVLPAAPVTAAPPAAVQRSAAPAAPSSSSHLDSLALDKVPEDSLAMVQRLIADVAKVADKRKKDTIEKAIVDMVSKLPSLGADVRAKLVSWAAKLGTPEGRVEWQQLSEAHWSAISSFGNIKFL